ncbi:NAC domain-containing protein 67-like [Magnolia sinica]|uniref:NAC domain-containing protein 67-like n=1 Tax=Magnolia sinica TaxID=86752 RepID=UPI002658F8B1|nr:NAC domain-containing protein 67-like [Magnolia sinica]
MSACKPGLLRDTEYQKGEYQVEGENMYFFTQLNLKDHGGSRVSRKAKDGFWASSDGYKHVEHQGISLGCKMITLNFFYKGVNSKGKKTNWLMKEYRLDVVKTSTMETTARGRKGKRVAETQDDNPKKVRNK